MGPKKKRSILGRETLVYNIAAVLDSPQDAHFAPGQHRQSTPRALGLGIFLTRAHSGHFAPWWAKIWLV